MDGDPGALAVAGSNPAGPISLLGSEFPYVQEVF